MFYLFLIALDPPSELEQEFKENLKICIILDISHKTFVKDKLKPHLKQLGFKNIKQNIIKESTDTGYLNGYKVCILLPPISNACLHIERLRSTVNTITNAESNVLLTLVIAFEDFGRVNLHPLKGKITLLDSQINKENFQSKIDESAGMA